MMSAEREPADQPRAPVAAGGRTATGDSQLAAVASDAPQQGVSLAGARGDSDPQVSLPQHVGVPPAQQPAAQAAIHPASNSHQPTAAAAGPGEAAHVDGSTTDIAGDAAAAASQDFVQPAGPEERHPQKPTWRRGYSSTDFRRTEYLLCTLTPSDCSTKRLRPPREWYDSLMGANFASFVVGAQAPDGSAMSFLLKAHAYEYVKAEYYVQGGETKRMFRMLGFRPGDALKLTVMGKQSGIPTTRLEVIPAAHNPHAAAILAQAAQQAAKREARLAAQPRPPKGAKAAGGAKKRKPRRDSDWLDSDEEVGEWVGSDEEEGGQRRRPRQRKQFGEDYVVGLEEAWRHAQQSDDDYDAYPGYNHQHQGLHPGASAASSAQQGDSRGPALGFNGGMPQVVSTGAAEGRNVLRIKFSRPKPTTLPAPAATGATAGGGGVVAGPTSAREGDIGGGKGGQACALDFLAGLAQDVASPTTEQQLEQQEPTQAHIGSKPAVGAATGAARAPVVLLSKKLLRDDSGAVGGAALKLGWELGARSALQINRSLSRFGSQHHELAAVESFELNPTDCVLEVTVRLQQDVGRVDVLEQAIMQLVDGL